MPSEEDYAKFFRTADKDGNNELTLDELIDMLSGNGYGGNRTQIRKFFLSCDANNDNKVTYDEYMQAMGVQPPVVHKEAAYMRVFREFDKDDSGSIDRTELKAVMAEMGKNFSDAEIKRMIELFDTDSDGTLNYKEFVKQVFGKE